LAESTELLTIGNLLDNLIIQKVLGVAETKPASRVKVVAKWIILAIVAIGLLMASRKAIEQWKTESANLQADIDLIHQSVAKMVPGPKRTEMEQKQERLEKSRPSIANLRWGRIGIAALLYAVALVPAALVLRRALTSLGQNPRVATSIAAQLMGHVGKYVPGKAMVIVLRVSAMSVDDVRPLATTIAVFVETFILMAVGAAVAGLVVLWLPVPTWIMVTALLFAVVASLPTLPPILRRVAARVSKVKVSEIDSLFGVGLVVYGWSLSLLSWSLFGASFAVLITAIPSSSPLPPPIELYMTATAAISLAMVVGFASLVPGGAGVRELVLTTVLGVSIGAGHGLLAAIAMRVLTIVVEVILAAGSWFWLRYTVSIED